MFFARPLNRLIATLALTGLMQTHSAAVRAVEGDDKPVKAPPNHVVISDTLNGWYFVPKKLKKSYDDLLGRLESLQSELDSGHVDGINATEELDELKASLTALRQGIVKSRVHVEGATMHEQTETMEFELGPEKRLAITANHVRIVGWNDAKVKVELKRMVLSKGDTPSDDQLRAIGNDFR